MNIPQGTLQMWVFPFFPEEHMIFQSHHASCLLARGNMKQMLPKPPVQGPIIGRITQVHDYEGQQASSFLSAVENADMR